MYTQEWLQIYILVAIMGFARVNAFHSVAGMGLHVKSDVLQCGNSQREEES